MALVETLSQEEYEILNHTVRYAARQTYCGSSAAMQSLVEKGFMRGVGKPSWSKDEYFIITAAGREALAKWGRG